MFLTYQGTLNRAYFLGSFTHRFSPPPCCLKMTSIGIMVIGDHFGDDYFMRNLHADFICLNHLSVGVKGTVMSHVISFHFIRPCLNHGGRKISVFLPPCLNRIAGLPVCWAIINMQKKTNK